jgi:hypothetical protein
MGGSYEAAVELVRAVDLLRTLRAAGRDATGIDLYRTERARARWTGARQQQHPHGRHA